MTSHNERIAATRQQAYADFRQITSTNLSTAKHYLHRAAFDLERAVSLFYEAGGAPLPSDDEGGEEVPDEGQSDQPDQTQENASDDADTGADDGDPISAILDAARKEAPPGSTPPATSFGGRGFSLNSPSAPQNDSAGNASPSAIKVRVTFYRDGFTDQEDKEVGAEKEQRETGPRRRGVHSFSSSPSSTPRVPPKRAYEENAQFIKDVQDSRVPMEYRRRDEQKRPVPVSILLDDQRKRDYPVDMWRKQQQEEEAAPSHFGGAGQMLGGSPCDSSPSTSNNNENGNENNNNLVAWLLSFLFSWWGALYALVTHWIRQVTAVPLEKHTVDRQKGTTTISLRMPDNKRERVEFNTDHTVADLRRYCRLELEGLTEDNLELLAGFPPKTVRHEQNASTLKDAGLLNSAVDVRVLSNPKDKRQN